MSKKIVTNKQRIILTLIYIFRFLNSKQIQEFLNHKDHRRINGWLKDLTEKEYVNRKYEQIFGVLTKPALYNLTAKGRSYIRKSYSYFFPKYLRRISRDNKASKAFQIRCQIIADWYLTSFHTNGKAKDSKSGIEILNYLLNLLNIGKDNLKIPMNKLQFFTSAYFPSSSFKLLEEMKQDAYARRKTAKGMDHILLFVVDAYIPRFLLRYTLKKIFDTLNNERWEESVNTLQFFFLCPNNKIIIYMKRLLPSYLKRYYGSKEVLFHFSTRNQLYKKKKGEIEMIPWITLSSKDDFYQ